MRQSRSSNTRHPGLILILASTLLLTAGCTQRSGSTSPGSAASHPSDHEIDTQVQTQLHNDSALGSLPITTQARNGVVTLSGQVNDQAARELAANDAAQVKGVRTVINNLTVQPGPATQPGPTSMTPAVRPDRKAETHQIADAKRQQAAQLRQRRREQQQQKRDVPQQTQAPQPTPVQQAVNHPPASPIQPNPQSQLQPAAPLPPVKPVAPPPLPAPPKPVTKTIVIPAGTDLPVRISETLESGKTQTNDSFHGALADNLIINGQTAIRRGASVTGVVVDAKDAGHFRGQSELTLQLQQIRVSHKDIAISTDSVIRKGKARGKDTALKAGGTALFGTLLGALAGGGRGAVLGAAAGAGAGTGANAVTHGQQVSIPSESLLHFKLSNPVKVTVTNAPNGRPVMSYSSGDSPQSQPPNTPE